MEGWDEQYPEMSTWAAGYILKVIFRQTFLLINVIWSLFAHNTERKGGIEAHFFVKSVKELNFSSFLWEENPIRGGFEFIFPAAAAGFDLNLCKDNAAANKHFSALQRIKGKDKRKEESTNEYLISIFSFSNPKLYSDCVLWPPKVFGFNQNGELWAPSLIFLLY